MSNREIHSVILNLNKNYSQNKGSSFSTIVNRQLEIKPNTEIALYGGSLTRAPIVLEADTKLDLEFTYAFPTETQIALGTLSAKLVTGNVVNSAGNATSQTKLTATIPKGTYSKLGFTKLVCQEINAKILAATKTSAVEPLTSGSRCKEAYPYKMMYEIKDGNYWLGLRHFIDFDRGSDLPDESVYEVKAEDLNDGWNTSNGITDVVDSQYQRIFKASSLATNWESYSLGNSAIKGMSYSKLGDDDILASDVSFSSTIIQSDATAFTGASNFLFALGNTWFADQWGAVGASPTLKPIKGYKAEPTIPAVLIGAYFDLVSDGSSYTKQHIVIVANQAISQLGLESYSSTVQRDGVNNEDMRVLAMIDIKDYSIDMIDSNTFAFDVYCENVPKDLVTGQTDAEYDSELNRKYYFRFLAKSPWGDGQFKVLYDSKNDGTSLNRALVETGYLFQQLTAPSDASKQVTGGLCPQYYFYNTGDSILVTNPRANNIANMIDGDSDWVINKGQISYNFGCKFEGQYKNFTQSTQSQNTQPTALQNILGISQQVDPVPVSAFGAASQSFNLNTIVSYDPNLYPSNRDLAGLTELGSDRTRYNIEVNLPIRAYNTTTQKTNDIGQTRTILYNTNPLVEDSTVTTGGLINRSLVPIDIKYLSLNNPQAIKLNELVINVRRANTNELATEITDASLEILLKKE